LGKRQCFGGKEIGGLARGNPLERFSIHVLEVSTNKLTLYI
jgi:hypothetical protein